MAFKQSTTLTEFLWVWISIMICISILGSGFVISARPSNYSNLNITTMYSEITGDTSVITNELNNTINEYGDPEGMGEGSGFIQTYILNPIDSIVSIGRFIAGIISFAMIGTTVTTFVFWDEISPNNYMIVFIVNIFQLFIGILFFIKLYNTATKKGVQE